MFKRKSLTVWAGWEKHPGEHPSSFSASQNGNSSQLLCGHMMYRAGVSGGRRGPSEHTSPASLTSIKANILRPCELSATWCFLPEEWWQQPECVWEPLVEQKAEEKRDMCVCLHMCQQQVWFFTAALWTLRMKYIFHTGNAKCIFFMLTLPGWPGQEHVTLRRRMRPKWCQEVRTRMGVLAVQLSQHISWGSAPAVLTHMGVVRPWHRV